MIVRQGGFTTFMVIDIGMFLFVRSWWIRGVKRVDLGVVGLPKDGMLSSTLVGAVLFTF
jgi:hypothetical protein